MEKTIPLAAIPPVPTLEEQAKNIGEHCLKSVGEPSGLWGGTLVNIGNAVSLDEYIRIVVREELAVIQKNHVAVSGTITAESFSIGGEKAALGEQPELIVPLKNVDPESFSRAVERSLQIDRPLTPRGTFQV